MGQTEDGDGGHEEGEGAALYDGEAAPQGHLQYSTVQYSTVHPMVTCSSVTSPDTKKIEETIYPRAGSSSLLMRSRGCEVIRW